MPSCFPVRHSDPRRRRFVRCWMGGWIGAALLISATARAEPPRAVKRLVDDAPKSDNLLRNENWGPWQKGFDRSGSVFVCNNGTDQRAQRGITQTITLDQQRPQAIIARVESRCEEVSGGPDNNYALYLDISYRDGTHLWGQTAPFRTGTHDWQQRQVVVLPEKPIRSLSFHMLLRSHSGCAWFRRPELFSTATPAAATVFDGVVVVPEDRAHRGFLIRDVAANSSLFAIERRMLDVQLEVVRSKAGDVEWYDVTVRNLTARPRAITLYFVDPVSHEALRWWQDARRQIDVAADHEYSTVSHFRDTGSNGRLSRYPLAAVTGKDGTRVLGIDLRHPAFFRVGYHARPGQLFLAYDLGFAAGSQEARLRFCRYAVPGEAGFRGALQAYYAACPESFTDRLARHGLWMPFAPISKVPRPEDFGFRFKEGDSEADWDDAHNVLTFRYTEPMTWWMRMPESLPRTMDAASALARQLAAEGKSAQARALLTSGYRDQQGQWIAQIRDTPWCNGAVWSLNSMPGIPGSVTDFRLKWNADLRDRLYGRTNRGTLDGEYIDSSEGYVTAELDFCADHFAAADTPLCFSQSSHVPAIFRGAIAFEYVRRLARDLHAMGRLTMANSTPSRICWLAPWLDVMGTETNWNPGGNWRPMSDSELLYRRSMCYHKPFCFLMNTDFDRFPAERVEKYMKRAVAFGMFPGFFSHNASQGHYFTRPNLYERDRPLFRKYVPVCRVLSEAGWQPVTEARTDDPRVLVERFGDRYLTVFNDRDQRRRVTLQLSRNGWKEARQLLTGHSTPVDNQRVSVLLEAEDVAVIELVR